MQGAVAVSGHICSGKSTIVNYLANSHNWDVVSFGKYIAHIVQIKGLPPIRKNYQVIGQQIINNRGPCNFLRDVVTYNQPTSGIHLFDGVRHVAIVNAIRKLYKNTSVIYVAANNKLRYERYRFRTAEHDRPLTFEEFLRLDEHPVEQEVSKISHIADIHLDTSDEIQHTIAEIENYLSIFLSNER